METVRVDVCYRPLRIGWAIRDGDWAAFRTAVRYSYALWGGRFNPIIVVDREDEARRLIDLFRVDVVLPIGVSDELTGFLKKHSHLVKPFFHESLFVKGSKDDRSYAQALDVHNALAHLIGKPELKEIKDQGVSLFSWSPDDRLADVFLAQLGGYPSADEVGTDYRALLLEASDGVEHALDPTAPLPRDLVDHVGIPYFSRHGVSICRGAASFRNTPGFFVGSAASLGDLICHWNLRACDIALLFVDPSEIERFAGLIPVWETAMSDLVAGFRYEQDRRLAVWTRQDDAEGACSVLGNPNLLPCHVSDATWNGLNVRAPTMHFGHTSVLGIMGGAGGKPKVSFALAEKPFCDDVWFNQAHLVASVSIIGGLYGDEQHTFHAPYLPELNEFYGRTMTFEYNTIRVEPGRIGVVIDAAERDSFLNALPTSLLMERVFGLAGYDIKLSSAGLIARQLIRSLGGVQGARVFKIPGVRRLLRTHGSGTSFSKTDALRLIGGPDPERPDAKFSDHADLYVEARASGEKLTARGVFEYLVEKGLLRVGADLVCSACRMTTWTPLETLGPRAVCGLCGNEYDASRQLGSSDRFQYRRSGVLGVERNAQGAVPVTLTLQQLDTSLRGAFGESMYSPSVDLTPRPGTDGATCELDFVWLTVSPFSERTVVIIGEVKDKGPFGAEVIRKLQRVADALPPARFDTFVALTQLAPFTDDEIQSARTLNTEHRRRAILLTARDLEPYYLATGHEAEEMAEATATRYFK